MKITLLILLFSHVTLASVTADLRVIGRLHNEHNGLTLVRSLDGKPIPSVLHDQSLKKYINSLLPGDDVVVEGNITYITSYDEDGSQLEPVFVITSLRPISLSRLGDGPAFPVDEHLPGKITGKTYSPMVIPVTTEVASAMTLTTSLLFMQSLSASATDPEVRQELNSGLIFFAGALATGVFIFEQVFGHKP